MTVVQCRRWNEEEAMTSFDEAARLHEQARLDWTPEAAVTGVLLTAVQAETRVPACLL
jgi:hypothetical protein